MDVLDETFKSSSKNSGFKNLNRPSLVSNKIVFEYEDSVDLVEDNKSICTMKKIYSVERIAYNASATKVETQNKSNEKLTKNGKLFRSSSTTLDRDYVPNEFNLSKVGSGTDHKNQISANDLFLLDILDMKKFALSNFIQENPKAADLKWSLFCAACHSYRYDSVLRPFPPMFVDGEVKNIERLRDVAESCPSINVLSEQIQERNSDLVSSDLINLLYWVLIHVREPQLKFIPKDMHSAILSKVGSTSAAATPKYIFQVQYNKHVDVEKFNDMAKKHKIIHAFHGSRLDNFYSLLNFGLRISFNKMCAYGPGIYLSSEMNVSLPYSQSGFSWGGSYFGSRISIVALCEMLDHPDVQYSDGSAKKKKNNFWSDLNSLPEKYFVVQNSDLIRVKYLLIYRDSSPEINSNHLSTVITWFQKNKVIAVVIAYVILLLAIATSNNSTVYKYYKRVVRKLGWRVGK